MGMSFSEMSDKWTRNKEKLQFDARLTVDQEGKTSIVIEHAPKRYLKAIHELANGLITAGLTQIADNISVTVAEKDIEIENAAIRKFLDVRKLDLLNILLENGREAFIAALRQDSLVLQIQYNIGSLKPCINGWVRWDGATLTSNGWLHPDGKLESFDLFHGAVFKESQVVNA